MVLRKHTLYNIQCISFEWICIYTNILCYELIKNNNIILKQECLPCVQVIDCWQFSDGTFFFLTLNSFRCTGNSLLWRAIGTNMLDFCGGLFKFLSKKYKKSMKKYQKYRKIETKNKKQVHKKNKARKKRLIQKIKIFFIYVVFLIFIFLHHIY